MHQHSILWQDNLLAGHKPGSYKNVVLMDMAPPKSKRELVISRYTKLPKYVFTSDSTGVQTLTNTDISEG